MHPNDITLARVVVVLVLLVALGAAACSDDTTPATDAGPPDVAADTTVDVTTDVAGDQMPVLDVAVGDAAHPGTTKWIATAASSGTGRVEPYTSGAFVGPGGDVYITGIFSGTTTFGTTTLVSKGGYDIFVARLAPDGSFAWAFSAGGTGQDLGACVSADAAGNVYATAFFGGSATFGTESHNSAGGMDIAVTKLSPDGAHLWTKVFGGTGDDIAYGCALDAGGNLVVGAGFASTITVGSKTLTSQGKIDALVFKLDPQGQATEAWQPGSGTEVVQISALDLDSSGNVYLAGLFQGTATFGAQSLTSTGDADVFVSKLSPTGAVQWTARGGGAAQDVALALVVEPGGAAYVTGTIEGPATFGTIQVPHVEGGDIFVAKIAPGGTFAWANASGGTGSMSYPSDIGHDVTLAPNGDLILAGAYRHAMTIGGWQLTGCVSLEGFVARYDATSGTPTWVLSSQTKDPGCTRAYAARFDANGDLIVVGKWRGETTLGTTTLTAKGTSYDLYIWKLTPP